MADNPVTNGTISKSVAIHKQVASTRVNVPGPIDDIVNNNNDDDNDSGLAWVTQTRRYAVWRAGGTGNNRL
jgi:hypothetical protein